MASKYENIDKPIAIHRVGNQLMYLADGSKWGFLTNQPRGKWESSDEIIISAVDSKKITTLYSAKNISKNEVSQVILLGEPFANK